MRAGMMELSQPTAERLLMACGSKPAVSPYPATLRRRRRRSCSLRGSVGSQARVLEGLPGHFEGQALLRIHLLRLGGRDAEEAGIEARDIVQKAAPAAGHLSRRQRVSVEPVIRVPTGGGNSDTPSMPRTRPAQSCSLVWMPRGADSPCDDGDRLVNAACTLCRLVSLRDARGRQKALGEHALRFHALAALAGSAVRASARALLRSAASGESHTLPRSGTSLRTASAPTCGGRQRSRAETCARSAARRGCPFTSISHARHEVPYSFRGSGCPSMAMAWRGQARTACSTAAWSCSVPC